MEQACAVPLKRKSYKQMAVKVLSISVGSLIISFAFNAFVIPYGLLSGGVSGLALIMKYLTGFPLYLGIFLLNIPIFIWSNKELDRDFVLFSLITTIVLVIALPLTKPYIRAPEVDLFLAATFSGVLIGIGNGIIFKFGSSPGGTSMIAMMVKKKKNIAVTHGAIGTFSKPW